MRRVALLALLAITISAPAVAFGAGCYGLPDPTGIFFCGDPVRCAAYRRDCETVRSLISCGIQQRDAVAMVVNRRTMDGYIGQIIAKCVVERDSHGLMGGTPAVLQRRNSAMPDKPNSAENSWAGSGRPATTHSRPKPQTMPKLA
jgi:hypothetical protein